MRDDMAVLNWADAMGVGAFCCIGAQAGVRKVTKATDQQTKPLSIPPVFDSQYCASIHSGRFHTK